MVKLRIWLNLLAYLAFILLWLNQILINQVTIAVKPMVGWHNFQIFLLLAPFGHHGTESPTVLYPSCVQVFYIQWLVTLAMIPVWGLEHPAIGYPSAKIVLAYQAVGYPSAKIVLAYPAVGYPSATIVLAYPTVGYPSCDP